MLGKGFLASAYLVTLSYSLSYAGEPIKEIKPLVKNDISPSQSQPYSKIKKAEIDTKQERRLDNSKLDKIATSNNSPIPWATRGSAEQGFYRPNGLRIINFRF